MQVNISLWVLGIVDFKKNNTNLNISADKILLGSELG